MTENRMNQRQHSRLATQLRNAETRLAHKRTVMGRHQSGTSWHTTAKRDAECIERRIADLRRRLSAA